MVSVYDVVHHTQFEVYNIKLHENLAKFKFINIPQWHKNIKPV